MDIVSEKYRTLIKIAFVLFLCMVGVSVFLICWGLFVERVSFEVVSISPDGMYKCELREYCTGSQSRAIVKLFKRAGSDADPWVCFKTEGIYNDSCSRAFYSLDWQYGDSLKTERLFVFGDFGTPSYSGDPILEMPVAVVQEPAEEDKAPNSVNE